MKKYELDDVEKLFRLSRELTNRPNHHAMDETQALLSRLIESEAEWETPLSAMLNRSATRGRELEGEIRISETPVAISAEDSLGHTIKIVLECAHHGEGLQLIGVLHADTKSPWSEYTVLVSQEEVIEDFAEIAQGEDFTLQLKGNKPAILKFISSSHEVILLKDVKIDSG
ncbi:hypothetical protein G4Y79_16510 [Phototrophicus methaneseepsis]|uniref:Uncharacterized protein n=1 Tax=Phototrophicus methaneseepsis TaxID=2710758 RepID=A0A7S8IDY9_9CHLR|nr:hypothetical protein [Phototrophicus methaneseepsis]QPC81298.1 hypothetical protein G4Y79_16510 [Phototrophicus methaneseepsis]